MDARIVACWWPQQLCQVAELLCCLYFSSRAFVAAALSAELQPFPDICKKRDTDLTMFATHQNGPSCSQCAHLGQTAVSVQGCLQLQGKQLLHTEAAYRHRLHKLSCPTMSRVVRLNGCLRVVVGGWQTCRCAS